jgi:diguanylate cyclase (GGDEF)-like protein
MYSLIENGQMVGNIYIFQDVTHDMETLVDLLEKANYDALSGVFNKYKLIEEAQKAFYVADKNKTDLSVLMIDIDLFKEINDTFGHLAGDHAIQALTTIFKQICCPIDIIGRYGGEEFLILLPNTPHQKAIGIAESLRSMVEQKNFCYEDKEIHFTISVGVTTMTGRSKAVTLLSLISKADEALYQAKHLGRNRVAYSPLDE